ncbi:SCA7, zinc-binding domain-containing protein [Limtongia smithiae]|uniref:SCA7, zinc-binding domain-containing protein n=1 Tax=Limtongia smithiae TaxID=1125753 RepID=UPI0034CF4075
MLPPPPADRSWQEYARELAAASPAPTSPHSATSSAAASPSLPRSLAATASPPSSAPRLQARDRAALSSVSPLTDKLEYGICRSCDRPFLQHALLRHIPTCIAQKRAESAARAIAAATPPSASSSSSSNTSSATTASTPVIVADTITLDASSRLAAAGNGSAGSASTNGKTEAKATKNSKKADKDKEERTPTKKRKAEATAAAAAAAAVTAGAVDDDKPPPAKKTKKKQPPKAAPKPKGPVNVERQCGVELPNGGYCARSLTCKSHSMGAKRNVPGRSQPYDILLAAYQKKNQLKQAQLTSSAQLAEDMELNSGPVDSDEEVDSVMRGVRRAYAVPLERNVIFPVRIKNQLYRMRELFENAFSRQI